jgi:hypothetical protein
MLSFREKSTWISLFSTVLLFGYYYVVALPTLLRQTDDRISIIGHLVGVIILLIIVQVVLHTVVAIYNRKEAQEGADERDKLIQLKATRVSYAFLVLGAWGTILIAFKASSPLMLGHLILLFFVLAEIAGYTTRLIHYRRGV